MSRKKDEELVYPIFKAAEVEDREVRFIINNIKDVCTHYNNLHSKLCQTESDNRSNDSKPTSSSSDVDANNTAGCASINKESSRKRRNTDDVNSEVKVKITKFNDIPVAAGSKEENVGPNLLNLSDDVLLNIFQYVHPFDLVSVSRTCVRLSDVCRDRTLWAHIDFQFDDIYMKKIIDFNKFLKFILPTTQSIKKTAVTLVEFVEYVCSTNITTQISVTPKFMKAVAKKATNLKRLAIENHIICATKFTMDCLPQSLEYLSLKNTAVIQLAGEKSYFFQIHTMLPNLRVLDLTGCQWFRSQSFLAISKLPVLQELYLKGCLSLDECVPYASLASFFGFPSLEVLDLRLTQVSDSDVCCFNRVKYLKKLYLQSVNWHTPNSISDISIVSFGKNREPLQQFERNQQFVIIRNRHYQKPLESLLETLVIRNFLAITDISLKHAASCLPFLKHLDVRGTSCSQEGVNDFKRLRPDVKLLSDYTSNQVEESVL